MKIILFIITSLVTTVSFSQSTSNNTEISINTDYILNNLSNYQINAIQAKGNSTALVNLSFLLNNDEINTPILGSIFYFCDFDSFNLESSVSPQFFLETGLCEKLGKKSYYDLFTLSEFKFSRNNPNGTERGAAIVFGATGVAITIPFSVLLGPQIILILGPPLGFSLGSLGLQIDKAYHNIRRKPAINSFSELDLGTSLNGEVTNKKFGNKEVDNTKMDLLDFLQNLEKDELNNMATSFREECNIELAGKFFSTPSDFRTCVEQKQTEYIQSWSK